MSEKITEYKPITPLNSFVEFYWEGDFNTTSEPLLSQLVVPNGFIELIIHQSDTHCDLLTDDSWSQSPDYTIIGLYTRPYEVQFRNHVNVFGIRFKPEGIFNLFGIPASLFSERFDDMESVLGSEFRVYCSRLKDEGEISQKLLISHNYLKKQLQKHYPEKTYVNRAADLIRQPETLAKIEELPEKVFISLRQLEREFKSKVGVTPKQYMRISRLNAINRYLQTNTEMNFSELSHETGFSDQAHLCREFKLFSGLPPAKFLESIEKYIVNV